MLHNIRIDERLLADDDFDGFESEDDVLNEDRILAGINETRQTYIQAYFQEWVLCTYINKLICLKIYVSTLWGLSPILSFSRIADPNYSLELMADDKVKRSRAPNFTETEDSALIEVCFIDFND